MFLTGQMLRRSETKCLRETVLCHPKNHHWFVILDKLRQLMPYKCTILSNTALIFNFNLLIFHNLTLIHLYCKYCDAFAIQESATSSPALTFKGLLVLHSMPSRTVWKSRNYFIWICLFVRAYTRQTMIKKLFKNLFRCN